MKKVYDMIKKRALQVIIWISVALLGAFGWSFVALARGEAVNTIWFIVAGVWLKLLLESV
jgi:carbon starvation protein